MSAQGTRESALASIAAALTRVVSDSSLEDDEKARWIESIREIDENAFLANIVSLSRAIVKRVRPSQAIVDSLVESIELLAQGWREDIQSIKASRTSFQSATESLTKSLEDETARI